MSFTGHALACVRGDRLVFSDLDFQVDDGGCLLLKGPNGSGKSSLLRICAGFLAPYSGELRRAGQPLTLDPEAHRASLHFIGHLDGLKASLTVHENLAFWARFRTGEASRAEAALDRLELELLADLPVRFLSAGQRRRAALARLVVAPASLWLLDEPTTALDSAGLETLTDLIAEHRAAGGQVIAATHAPLAAPGAAVLRLGPTGSEPAP